MCRVILGCKDKEEGEAACGYINKNYENALVEIVELDLSNFGSVRKFAQRILETETKLDILAFLAEVDAHEKTITEDAQELIFQVNHLAHFLLANLMMDLLKASESSR